MKAVVLSDLHLGSIFSIMPSLVIEPLLDGDYQEYEPNKLQSWLKSECWNPFRDYVRSMKCKVGVMNGDGVDGINDRADSLGTWSSNIRIQAGACVELLQELGIKKWYIVNGTRYHTKKNPSGDELVAELLPKSEYVHQDFILNANGNRLHIKHHHNQSSTYYDFTSIFNELNIIRMKHHQYGEINGLIRSHTHSFKYAKTPEGMVLSTPCWKMRDEYSTRNMKWTPQIGGCVVDLKNLFVYDMIWTPKVNIKEVKA